MTINEVVEAAAAAGFDVNVQQVGDIVTVFVTDKSTGTVTEFTGTASGEPLPEESVSETPEPAPAELPAPTEEVQ